MDTCPHVYTLSFFVLADVAQTRAIIYFQGYVQCTYRTRRPHRNQIRSSVRMLFGPGHVVESKRRVTQVGPTSSSKAIFGEKEWYFFSPRDRKYPNGSRPNRVAGSGYWKATGTDKIITTEGKKVGIKKALVFYVGKAPKGTKTNWIMHEYRLLDSSRKNNSGTKLDDWVLCRIYKKNSSAQKNGVVVSSNEHTQYSNGSSSSSSSHLDEVLESLPEIDESCFMVPRVQEKLNLGAGGGLMDWANPAVGDFAVQAHQTQAMANYSGPGCNDLYVPTLCHVDASLPHKVEEEVQSGVRNQRLDNSWFLQNDFAQGFSNPADTCGFKYPVQPVGFGFRQ
ncbi:hypothetical protein Fmac_019047 [Flemingia macrophylla]|uniref:NAC domain-containing protein n=1 Tax=Flemingia macrophylla TaxID=520843 RepID=A0ABD1M6T3_9FABA